MKASFLPVLCLVSSTLAAPLQLAPRDTVIIEGSIRIIRASLQSLAAEVKSLDSHRQGQSFDQHVALIKHHGEDLASTIMKGANDIQRAPQVTLFESTGLLIPVQQLTDATAQSTNAWISQKNTIIKSGGQQVVINILKNLRTSSDVYTKALVAKMPMGANYIGEIFGNQVRRSVDQALAAFGAR